MRPGGCWKRRSPAFPATRTCLEARESYCTTAGGTEAAGAYRAGLANRPEDSELLQDLSESLRRAKMRQYWRFRKHEHRAGGFRMADGIRRGGTCPSSPRTRQDGTRTSQSPGATASHILVPLRETRLGR